MKQDAFNAELLDYLQRSPTPFHAVSTMAETLTKAGFTKLNEGDSWDIKPGKYFVTRNGSSIIAFIKGTEPTERTGLRIVGAHTDSPCLKVKPNPERRAHGYLNIGVEVYGGVLLNP
ncbi:MAG: M18 family aminopeptidase, partial [Pseudomonadales bacterium]